MTQETWTAEYGECDPDDRGSIEIWHVNFPDQCAVYLYDEEARAKLIAAAPDMARVLLALEWSGEHNGEYCPSCEGYKPEPLKPGYHAIPGTQIGHFDDCALDAALRKAGLR